MGISGLWTIRLKNFLMCIICGLFPHEFMRLVALCACAAHTEYIYIDIDIYIYIYDLVPKGVHENRTKGVENKVDDTLKLVVFLKCAQC